MEKADLNRWAAKLQKQTYLQWKNYKWRYGFKVFYGPIRKYPKLMIISYQPGGNRKSFLREDGPRFKAGDFSVQAYNSYAERSHIMSRKVRELFESRQDLLKSSVIFPLIFFRAPSVRAWRLNKRRRQMEEFSYAKTKEIIETLRPREILVLGMHTYDKLKEILPESGEKILYRRNGAKDGSRMALVAKMAGIKTFVILHPSGARASKDDRLKMQKLFLRYSGNS